MATKREIIKNAVDSPNIIHISIVRDSDVFIQFNDGCMSGHELTRLTDIGLTFVNIIVHPLYKDILCAYFRGAENIKEVE